MKKLYIITFSKPGDGKGEGSWDIRTNYLWAKHFTERDAQIFIESYNDPIEGVKVNELREIKLKDVIKRYFYKGWQ